MNYKHLCSIPTEENLFISKVISLYAPSLLFVFTEQEVVPCPFYVSYFHFIHKTFLKLQN